MSRSTCRNRRRICSRRISPRSSWSISCPIGTFPRCASGEAKRIHTLCSIHKELHSKTGKSPAWKRATPHETRTRLIRRRRQRLVQIVHLNPHTRPNGSRIQAQVVARKVRLLQSVKSTIIKRRYCCPRCAVCYNRSFMKDSRRERAADQ